MRRQRSTGIKVLPVLGVLLLLILWQSVSMASLLPHYLLPSPTDIVMALVRDFGTMMKHTRITLIEAFLGLGAGILLGFLLAVLMDAFPKLYEMLYPLIVLTQTVPTVAIAPLLVLWFGYGILPKIVLIVLVTFFPMAVGLLEGFRSVDMDAVALLRSMGAGRWEIFRFMKLPGALPSFFGALKIAVSYSVVGAVIAEWLGGFEGLGVYMTQARKSYAYDRMFAIIFLISGISLLLMKLVEFLQKKSMPWMKDPTDGKEST